MPITSYDLVVIGGGAAGLTSAGLGASFGAKTLLIEKDRLGGDCTWTGCVPSKTLLRSAHVAHEIRNASKVGLQNQEPDFDFRDVMRQVHQIREDIYEDADSPESLAEFGIETTHGRARFQDAHTICIERDGGAELVQARFVVIATGAHPSAPPIKGLEEVNYLDNHSLFEIEEQPKQLAIIGGGPIGTEMAQAFQRLGTQVTVIDQDDRILQHDHDELAEMLRKSLVQEGVRFLLQTAIERVEQLGSELRLRLNHDGEQQTIQVDALLVATGRTPNVEGFNLDAARVEASDKGVQIDDRCRTSTDHIFAVGDVAGSYQFTHMGEHMAKVAISNALLKVPQKIDHQHVPWVTYSDPELAHVGATEQDLISQDKSYETFRFPLDRLDRAICERQTTGEIRIYATSLRGKILGADVLATRAGELIGTIALAMKTGATLRQIADTIFPYPTYGQGVRRAADQWYARKQKPWIVKGIQAVFGYDGPVIEPDADRIV